MLNQRQIVLRNCDSRRWLETIPFACIMGCWLLWAAPIGVATVVADANGLHVGPADRQLRDDLTKQSTWRPLNPGELSQRVLAWLDQNGEPAEVKETIATMLASTADPATMPVKGAAIDRVMSALSLARPGLDDLVIRLSQQRQGSAIPDPSAWIEDSSETTFFRQHVRLFFARWLAQNELYDEALFHLNQIGVGETCDPESLLFYRALVEHQLLKKAECELTLKQLLEQEELLARRVAVLAKLMLADIQPLEADSLDEIARIMNDIRRRTELNRSGKMVLGQEEEVIAKLDKLIDNLEAAQQQAAGSAMDAPDVPLKDSFRVGGKGSGEVTSKVQTEGGDWGNLPPADRAAALAEMAKDMPPHYRAAIEEYFRRLAQEKK